MQKKLCPCCKRKKSASFFWKDKSNKDGLFTYCKCCARKNHEKWRKSSKGRKRRNESTAKYAKTKKGKKANAKYEKSENGKNTRIAYWRSEKCKDADLRGRHGPHAVELWKGFFEKQDGICFGCGEHQSELKQRLSLDHDHENGMYRGLLCKSCNLKAGSSKKDLQILKNLVRYLEDFYKE